MAEDVRSLVETLYVAERKTLRETCARVGLSYQGLRRKMAEWGIPIRARGEFRRCCQVPVTRELLERLYWRERKSYRQIASELGCSKHYVQHQMESLGIPRRSKRECQLGELSSAYGTKWSAERRQERREKNRGAGNPNWRDGATRKNYTRRVSEEYLAWRQRVYERDNFTCIACGDARGGNLRAHHITNFSKVAGGTEEHAVYNGVTLCESCHKEFHAKYGNMNNDLEQLCAFLKITAADATSQFGIKVVTDIWVKEKSRRGPRKQRQVANVRAVSGLEAAFWQYVRKGTACWEWTGSISTDAGHGRFSFKYLTYCAHRVAWELTHGPLPAGQNIRHKCGNRRCVNPDHLELCGAGGKGNPEAPARSLLPAPFCWRR